MAPPSGPVRWLDRLRLRRPEPDTSVEWEIEHHLAEVADRLVGEGWSAEEARREAERRFGDRGHYGPSMRRMERGRLMMERWWRGVDVVRASVRSVGRTARRYPGFTAGVVVTLALGIGANATMVGIIDRLLLQPPAHIVDADEVKRVFIERPHFMTGEMNANAIVTYPDYEDLEAHRGLAGVAGYTLAREGTIGSGAEATRARVAMASASFFPLLGVEPDRGRFYSAEESAVGQPLTAVIGAGHWESDYGSDPGILGRVVEISGLHHTIVGVAPRGFTGMQLDAVDFWVPLEATRAAASPDRHCLDRRTCWWMSAVARLADGVSLEAAQAEATRLHRNGRAEFIDEGRYSERAGIVLGSAIAARGPGASGETRVARWLLGVSLLVLIIACANVANLLMARGTRQRREISVRLALGAGQRRVVSQGILESVLLALAGGAVAVLLAQWGGEIVRSALLPGVYFPESAFDGRLLVFTLAAAVVAGVAAGVAPALQGGRADIAGAMSEGARGSSQTRSRFRGFLTVTQAALSVLLLVGAGLFVKSLAELRSQDLGLDVDHLVLAQLEWRDSDPDPDRVRVLYEEAARQTSRLPGVRSAATVALPFGWSQADGLRVPGLDSVPRLPGGGPYHFPVAPSYFGTVGLEVLEGRPIAETDGPDDAPVAVVSRTMAATLWPREGALGRCIYVGQGSDQCITVVGVVEDAARNGYRDSPFMAYYRPSAQVDMPPRGMYVRAEGGPEEVTAAVAGFLRDFSSEVRYADVRSLAEVLDPQARAWTLGATMFSVFGLLALVLAAIGLYSVLSFDVAQRRRELGIRIALGARRKRLLRTVLVQGTRMGVLGIVLGLGAAYLAAPHASDLLFEVSPRDPWVLGIVAAVLASVSLLASLLPGLRATRVEAMETLRTE